MEAVRKYVKVDYSGKLTLEGLPFNSGEYVEVLIMPINSSRLELARNWKSLFKSIQNTDESKEISDNEIIDEINNFRKGL